MKKTFTILTIALMVVAAGCQNAEEAGKAAAPSVAAPVAAPQAAALPTTPQAAPPAVAPPKPANPHSGGDPHAGLMPKELAAGAGHKGKVLQAMDAGSYTYLEVEEKGQKLWVAALKAKVAKGDIVEFPDSKPMEHFQSKALNRTFDKVFFAEGIRVVK